MRGRGRGWDGGGKRESKREWENENESKSKSKSVRDRQRQFIFFDFNKGRHPAFRIGFACCVRAYTHIHTDTCTHSVIHTHINMDSVFPRSMCSNNGIRSRILSQQL